MKAHTQVKDRYAHIQFEGVRFPEVPRIVPRAPYVPSPPRVGPVIVPELSASDYSLLVMILESVGADPKHYRRETLARRLPACFRALRVRNALEACLKLKEEPACLETAADALLIGVTHFYRDAPVFDVIQKTIIPDILSRMSGCHVLSMPCSDGAELYSVLFSLAERDAVTKSVFCGVDCRTRAIAAARRGQFDECSLKNLPAAIRQRYFYMTSESGATVDSSLSRAIHWQVADAFAFASKGPWDLILCRNFAIYLNPATAARLWNRLWSMLRPGGYLVVGKAEKPTAGFDRVAPCVYRKPLL